MISLAARTDRGVLAQMQHLLASIYQLPTEHAVEDFLVTDKDVAQALSGDARGRDETLLIREGEDEAQIALYLDAELMARLQPDAEAAAWGLDDFLMALEGVSHFSYFVHSADEERQVTLMEMELQAEVDKFVSVAFANIGRGVRLSELHNQLFERARFADDLTTAERERYGDANRFASEYCWRLLTRLGEGIAPESLQPELRRFYRLDQMQKIRHIRI